LRTLDALVRLGLAGANELAQALGITQARVRQHLRTLLQHGLVEVAFVRGDGPGPRERVWRPTLKGQGNVRPYRVSSLFALFMRATRERVGQEMFVDLLRETAHLLAVEHSLAASTSLYERIKALQGLLDELAVASQLEELPLEYRLHLLTLAPWEPGIASSETGLFYCTLAEDFLDTRVELLSPCVTRRAVHTLQFHKAMN